MTKASTKTAAKTGAKAAAKTGSKTAAKATPKAAASKPKAAAKTAAAPKTTAKTAAPKAAAPKAAAPKAAAAPKPKAKAASGFKVGDHIVYPAHGVGVITGIERDTVAGFEIEVYVISFEQDKMTLRVPTAKARNCGMRPLASSKVVGDALNTLKGKARVKRTMWSRRAQEYEAKINSGDLMQIAEVVRDLHRADDQPEQSYSERQLYESALDRLVREVAAVENIDREAALGKLAKSLHKAA